VRHASVHRILHPTFVAIARTPLLIGQDARTEATDLPDGASVF
jgi:hypothetical protein